MDKAIIKSLKITAEMAVIGALLITNVAVASTTATVTSTVTLQDVSVTVTSGVINYGTLAAGTATTTLVGGLNDTQTASNTGNVPEDFNIKGSTSTSGWILSSTSTGVDQYMHKFCIATCGTSGSPGAGFTAMTATGYTTLATNVATSSAQTFDTEIIVPTSSSYFTTQSVDLTVQAVAH